MSKKVYLDEILGKFSLNQRYYIQLGFLIAFACATNIIHSSNYIFAFEEVNYRCINQNTSQTYCSLQSNETCTEWIYEKSDSFVAEFDLACQDWKRTTVGTIHSLGYMFGLLLIGPFSDRVGRKTAVVITGTLGGVFGVLKSFSNWYILYIAFEFLEGAIGDLCSPLYMLSVEFVSGEKRIIFVLANEFGYATGKIVFALTAWLVPHRRTMLRIIYAPAIFFTVYSFLLDESPRWLFSKGRKESAIIVLEKIAKINGTTVERSDLEELTLETEEKQNKCEVLKHTIQSKLLRKRFLICVVWWITSTFVSYGMIINSVSLQGNKYMNFILMTLLDIPVVLACVYVLKRFKRKKPLISCFLIGAIFCLVQPFISSDMPWLSIMLFIAGNSMSSVFITITYLYTSELFPTYTRNSMHAMCSSIGRIGSILAPQTPLLIHYWSGLPAFIFGLVSLFAGLITFLIPDVGDDSLPDTVRQAEALGKSTVLKELKNQQANVSHL